MNHVLVNSLAWGVNGGINYLYDNCDFEKNVQETAQLRNVNFHASRPGHDLRYGLSGRKMESMGWTLPLGFEESLRKTIEWTLENQLWLNVETWAGETTNVDSDSNL